MDSSPIPKKSCKAKFAPKQTFLRGDFTPFISIFFSQIWDHFFLLLFPKDSEPLNFLDIQVKKWGKKAFKRYLKSEQTDAHGHTDGHFI